MDQSMQSDARLLWDDATDLLAGTDAPEQLVRMMASCDPQDFSGGTLTVGAPSGFASRVLERERPRLEEALSSAAFEPVTVCLLYTSPSPRDISGSRMPSSA